MSLNWKTGLLALIAIAAGAALFMGPGGSRYAPPRIAAGEDEPRAQFNRAKFAETLKSLAAGRLIRRVEKGLSDHEVRLTAAPAWYGLDVAAREQAARAMWKAWAGLHPAKLRYKTRIVIVDPKGGKIGGSRLLDPSKIWVRKP